MPRKREYIVARNGVHIGWCDTRTEAEEQVQHCKLEDPELCQRGWITLKQLELTQYHIEVH